MTARNSKTTVEITSDIVRAFAEALDHGFTGSLNDFAASEDGQTAARAVQDQRNAALRSERMANSKTIWRDLKAFGTVASDKGIEAAKAEFAFLTSLGLDTLEATETAPVSTRKRKTAATTDSAPATDADADDTDGDDDDE